MGDIRITAWKGVKLALEGALGLGIAWISGQDPALLVGGTIAVFEMARNYLKHLDS